MTQDELAALDRAATQGVPITGHDWLRQFANDRGLADALLTLYRAGRIAVIDDEAVERAGFAIWHKLGQIEDSVRAGHLTKDEVRDLATAAIAAMGVK